LTSSAGAPSANCAVKIPAENNNALQNVFLLAEQCTAPPRLISLLKETSDNSIVVIPALG
jgi:hypothetical protein